MRPLIGIGLVLAASLQATAQESVRVITDRAKNTSEVLSGTIQSESPGGLVIKGRDGKNATISPLDIVMVQYKHESLAPLDFQLIYDRQNMARNATAPKDQADRLKQAEIAATKVLDQAGRPQVVRYARFKLAEIRTEIARMDGKEASVLPIWKQTALEVKGGWEELPALKALAEAQESQGSPEVLATYESMSKIQGLPADLAQRVAYLLAARLLQTGKTAEASAKLKGLPANPDTAVLQACANLGTGGKGVPELRLAMANATDPQLIAFACNQLGEALLADKKPEDAFWEFVRVDAQYPGDQAELARALYHLGTLYDTVGKDPRRASECLEKLKGREFANSPFQKKAAQLKTPAA
jgi:hypothetical protein